MRIGTLFADPLCVDLEVTSVELTPLMTGHAAIVSLGNNGQGWKLSVASAIRRIQARRDALYVRDRLLGRRVYVYPYKDNRDRICLRTASDGRWGDHLLSLAPIESCELVD